MEEPRKEGLSWPYFIADLTYFKLECWKICSIQEVRTRINKVFSAGLFTPPTSLAFRVFVYFYPKKREREKSVAKLYSAENRECEA